MREYTGKQFIQLRSRSEIHTQRERVWASSLVRKSAVSQTLGKDTHPERSPGLLGGEEYNTEVM